MPNYLVNQNQSNQSNYRNTGDELSSSRDRKERLL